MSARVSIEEVGRVAELAHLELTPEESGRIEKDLNDILNYIDQLNELDTTGVEPLAQINELINDQLNAQLNAQINEEISEGGRSDKGEDLESALRQDAIQPSLDRAQVMNEAPETDGTFFKVPKVIER